MTDSDHEILVLPRNLSLTRSLSLLLVDSLLSCRNRVWLSSKSIEERGIHMSFEHKTTDDLVRIAASGGGFIVTAGHKTTDDLVRIAAAAKISGSKVTFTGINHKTTNDLIRIGAAGKGCVILQG